MLRFCQSSFLEEALTVYNKKEVMINSFTAEENRIKALLPIVKNTMLCGRVGDGEGGIPQSVEERMKLVETLVKAVDEYSIPREHLFIDPLVVPIGTDQNQGKLFLETLQAIPQTYPGVRTVCGLSNISFGMPNRRLINRSFLALSIGFDLHAAIIDPLDDKLMGILFASEALMGRDEYCMNYLTAFRAGRLNE